jgi:diacylglycerol kinase (ATP)
MRAAIILGLGLSSQKLKPFAQLSDASWQLGLPAISSDADAILILGGDGTVHRHLPQLVKLQVPVLVVPYGSGNDFARALNIRSPGDAMNAWRQFASGSNSNLKNVQRIDLGTISPIPSPDGSVSPGVNERPGRYFCCVGGIGLDAEVTRRANQIPRAVRRHGGYLLSLLPALSSFQPLAVRVQMSEVQASRVINRVVNEDDPSNVLENRHDGPAMLVAFANTPTFGGGMRIAPKARVDDGKLDICVVGSMAKARLLRLLPSVYSGRHLDLPEVKYFQADRLRIETEKPSEVYADGEFICHTPVEAAVERAALPVIVLRK